MRNIFRFKRMLVRLRALDRKKYGKGWKYVHVPYKAITEQYDQCWNDVVKFQKRGFEVWVVFHHKNSY